MSILEDNPRLGGLGSKLRLSSMDNSQSFMIFCHGVLGLGLVIREALTIMTGNLLSITILLLIWLTV